MNFPSLFLASCLAGGLCGLLGGGGGVPLLLILRRFFPDSPKTAFALCVTLMSILAAVSLIRYAMASALPLHEAASMFFPAAVGGVLGGVLLGKAQSRGWEWIFTLICLIGGVRAVLA